MPENKRPKLSPTLEGLIDELYSRIDNLVQSGDMTANAATSIGGIGEGLSSVLTALQSREA